MFVDKSATLPNIHITYQHVNNDIQLANLDLTQSTHYFIYYNLYEMYGINI